MSENKNEIVVEGIRDFVPLYKASPERLENIHKNRQYNKEGGRTISIVGAVSIDRAATYFDGGSSVLKIVDHAQGFFKWYTLNKQLTTPGTDKSPNWGNIVAAPYEVATKTQMEPIPDSELEELVEQLEYASTEILGVLSNFKLDLERRKNGLK